MTAYSLASLVGIARIVERQHFPSDVFVGASLGYLIGRHVAHSAEAKPAPTWSCLHIASWVPADGGSGLLVSWDFCAWRDGSGAKPYALATPRRESPSLFDFQPHRLQVS
jgi:hypothetical protein